MLYGQSRIYYHGRHWGDTLGQSHFGAGIGPVDQDASSNRPIENATGCSGSGVANWAGRRYDGDRELELQ